MDKYSARKGRTILTFKDAQGNLLKNARVHAELVNHEFLFGTGAFFTCEMRDKTPKSEYYENVWNDWKQVFNYATLPFYFGRFEPEKGKPLTESRRFAVDLLRGADKAVKGHPLCWHTLVPDWMYGMSAKETFEYVLMRIERDVNAFKDGIRFWDVINETVIMPNFTNEPAGTPGMNPITNLCREMGRVPLVKALFHAAHEADKNATLLINDFVTSDEYADLIRDYLDAGVEIDCIGIQSHQHQGEWGLEKLDTVTRRFEQFGLPIHYTENTFVSGHLMPPEIIDLNDYKVDEWPSTEEGEQYQKERLEEMVEYLFSRPLVKAFTNWNFEDHQWLKAPSGLIRSDGSPKPSLLWLKDKLATDWHTSEDLVTDENGVCPLEGFRGEYRLTCGEKSADFTLNGKEAQNVTVG